MRFHKYEALGNDYLVLEPGDADPLTPAFVERVCDRHRGLGADGVLFEDRSAGAGLHLRIVNPDGSEAEKSGNGLRIFARYLWDAGRVDAAPFEVHTRGGTVRCEVLDGGAQIRVEMGRASFDSERIPVTGARRDVIDEPVDVAGETVRITALTIGNPHCVVHRAAVDAALAQRFGPLLERHPMFPRRTNVQFVEVVDRYRLRLEIWERGAGYTLASGSSSCAAAVASVRLGLCDRSVTVSMPGGDLQIEVGAGDAVTMQGPAIKIAEGTLSVQWQRNFEQ